MAIRLYPEDGDASLQDGIDALAEGDILSIAPGVYDLATYLNIPRPVHIKGRTTDPVNDPVWLRCDVSTLLYNMGQPNIPAVYVEGITFQFTTSYRSGIVFGPDTQYKPGFKIVVNRCTFKNETPGGSTASMRLATGQSSSIGRPCSIEFRYSDIPSRDAYTECIYYFTDPRAFVYVLNCEANYTVSAYNSHPDVFASISGLSLYGNGNPGQIPGYGPVYGDDLFPFGIGAELRGHVLRDPQGESRVHIISEREQQIVASRRTDPLTGSWYVIGLDESDRYYVLVEPPDGKAPWSDGPLVPIVA